MNTPLALEPKVEDEGPDTEGNLRKPRSRRRWWVWPLTGVILIGGAYGLLRGVRGRQRSAVKQTGRSEPRSIPVTATAVRKGPVSVYLNGLGSVVAFNTVTAKSRVDGQLIRIAFQEGQFVQNGDLLAEIDPRPFEVQLAQAEGQLARDQSQLNNAKVDLARYQTLLEEDSIPKQQLDTQAATVAQFEGAIKADQAQIESARLQLTYCHITAPIGGRVGLRLVDQGNIVHANDQNGVLVITQIQPISVLFTIPEDNLPPVLKRLRAGARLQYTRPAAPVPPTYKEPAQSSGVKADNWKTAQPSDQVARGKWWEIYNDPQLNGLEEQVNISNLNLKVAEAQFRQARARVRLNRAGYFPTITAGLSSTGSHPSLNRSIRPAATTSTTFVDSVLSAEVSYEPDVWGRVHNTVEASVAGAQASAADLETLRLSVHAELAADYFTLRALDAEKQLLDSTVADYEKALELTTN